MAGTRIVWQVALTMLIAGTILPLASSEVDAQGRLGRARKSVSGKKQKPVAQPKRDEDREPPKKSVAKPAAKPPAKRKPAPAVKSSSPRKKTQGRIAAVSSVTRKQHSTSNGRHDSHRSSHHRGQISHQERLLPFVHFGASHRYEPPVVIHDIHVHEYYPQPYAPTPLTADLPPVYLPEATPVYRANNDPSGAYVYEETGPYTDISAVPNAAPPVADTSDIVFADDWFSSWNAKMTAIYGSDFDDLTVTGLEMLVVAPGSLGLEIGANHLLEEGANYRNHLWIGDANVVFEVLGDGPLRGRVGVGVNWLGDSIGVEAGLNLTAGFDLHLNERWTLAGQADVGSLGDADFSHLRMDIGRRFGNAEWIVGYDRYEIDGIGLGNWTTGLRLRF